MAEVAIFSDVDDAVKFTKDLQKKIDSTKDGSQKFAGILSATIFRDIMDHFSTETGEDGPWTAWSQMYYEHMEKQGIQGNKILQDTGRLRQAFLPGSYRVVSDGYLWFNPAKTKDGFPYAKAHDEGGDRLPQRSFMWLSKDAMEKISSLTLAFILDERA